MFRGADDVSEGGYRDYLLLKVHVYEGGTLYWSDLRKRWPRCLSLWTILHPNLGDFP